MNRRVSRKMGSRIALSVVVILIGIQAIPVNRVNPPASSAVPAPSNVRSVLQRACYDCHSNETVWPWYSHVAPFSWLIARDVHEGRRELNFSTWDSMTSKRQTRKLQETSKEVEEGNMPPFMYLMVHREATLSADDRAALQSWTANALRTTDTARSTRETPPSR